MTHALSKATILRALSSIIVMKRQATTQLHRYSSMLLTKTMTRLGKRTTHLLSSFEKKI